jgi:hypothetical protein
LYDNDVVECAVQWKTKAWQQQPHPTKMISFGGSSTHRVGEQGRLIALVPTKKAKFTDVQFMLSFSGSFFDDSVYQ